MIRAVVVCQRLVCLIAWPAGTVVFGLAAAAALVLASVAAAGVVVFVRLGFFAAVGAFVAVGRGLAGFAFLLVHIL